MPLWRFKVGDFRSPIESAIGLRPKIVCADDVEEHPNRVGWFGRRKAKREVEAIRKAVEAANGVPIRWNDDGGVEYSGQANSFEPLRVYSKWLDCRKQVPEFIPPPNGDYAKHPVMSIEVERPRCPHLVRHDCYNGYFLPCEFEQLAEVEPYLIFGQWPATRTVGSSSRLLRELDLIQIELKVPDDYEFSKDDPLVPVKWAYQQLKEVAELSCRHGLPIIFWG